MNYKVMTHNGICLFQSNKNEAQQVYDIIRDYYDCSWMDKVEIKIEYNVRPLMPRYTTFERFKHSFYNGITYKKIYKDYDNEHKYIVANNSDIYSIIRSSPSDANLSFIDIRNLDKFPQLNETMITYWDTKHIYDFAWSFYCTDYKYDLDWMFIRKGATITDMFKNSKFNKKLPIFESHITLNELVSRTGLIVTPELITNNYDISLKEWCFDDYNQILMETNKQYLPMLEFWVSSNFISSEKKTQLMEESGIEIFDI